jgi:hypothetical protein
MNENLVCLVCNGGRWAVERHPRNLLGSGVEGVGQAADFDSS